MTDTITLDIIVDDSVDITIDEDTVDITTIEDPVFAVVAVEGPAGPQGATGTTTFTGAAWYYGSGEPGTIVGSKPGDQFMDLDTGDIWTLGG